MTPELKTSCEVVFQQHKTSPITWNKDPFRGRMSIGLCEMAKETLVQKHIIYFPKPAKKTITVLNPVVANAATFEEAVVMMQNNVTSALVNTTEKQFVYVTTPRLSNVDADINQLIENNGNSEAVIIDEKWWLRPLFFYVVWPISSAIVSVLIAYLMSELVEMAYR